MSAKFYDVEQNTDEWLALRVGKVTSSSMGCVMANYGKAFGEPAKKYALQIALERITGKKAEYSFSNDHTARGHEQEPIARMMYESLNFVDVRNGGFFEAGTLGASPDGLVEHDGLIEIKSVVASTHYDTLVRGSFDPSYKWQLYSNLKITEREWIDYVSFCDEFTDEKKTIIHRIYAHDCPDYFSMIDERLHEFEGLIKQTIERIEG